MHSPARGGRRRSLAVPLRETEATLDQFREFVVHRSLYQLKRPTRTARRSPSPRAGEDRPARSPERRVRRWSSRSDPLDPLRDHHAQPRARRPRERLPEPGPGDDAGDGQPDVGPGPAASADGSDRRPPGDVRDDLGPARSSLRQRPTPARARRPNHRLLRRARRGRRRPREHRGPDSPAASRERSPAGAGDILFGARALLHLEKCFAESLLGSSEERGTSLRGSGALSA